MLDLDQLSKIMPNLFFWKKDINSIYVDFDLNHPAICLKKSEFCGLSDYEIPTFTKIANNLQVEDKIVTNSHKVRECLTICQYPKCGWVVALITKIPWHDSNNNIIGTFGYGQNITHLVNKLSGLLTGLSLEKKIIPASFIVSNSFSMQTKIETSLTTRESECLFLLIRGRTIKQIGKILQLSPRTIEQYVWQLRDKFNCLSKAELIAKLIELGFLQYIPKRFLTTFIEN